MSLGRDITAQRKAEKELADYQARLEEMVKERTHKPEAGTYFLTNSGMLYLYL
jgi:hypothetical protein